MSSFPAAEADCLFKPTAIYILPLYLERKSTNFFRVKLKFLWPGPAEPSPLANALCNHFELHSSSVVQKHIHHSIRVGEHTPNGAVTSLFMLLHFRGSLVYALCLLAIITVQCITITLAPLFSLSCSFLLYVGWRLFFLFN